MYVLLIRHGETVDNVAGLYAGTRDSALTNHGVIQAERLGDHIRNRRDAIGPVRYLFASDLQRAFKTAQAIADAQHDAEDDEEAAVMALNVQRVPEIREKDFGSSEGKKFGTRAAEENTDAETSEAIRTRLGRFIDDHLTTIFQNHASENVATVIVSHGIVLSALLRVLVARYPSDSDLSLKSASEYHTPWTNTGVLQAKLRVSVSSTVAPTLGSTEGSDAPGAGTRLRFVVQSINNTDHLKGLRKTRGGIGSAKFDKRQRTMDSFFASASNKGS